MKLIVQIPVLNEADSIATVLAAIPRAIPGVDRVEVLLIDDGCTDDTVAVALAHGADHVVRHTSRRGLAAAYQTGIDACLRLGAHIIVNTDGDNQYPGAEIARLVAPIVAGQADMVIGDRQTGSIAHFSPFKKRLQAFGSGVVRWASETEVPDTVSGFRAFSREYALRTFVTSDFSYTVENIIQAGKRRLTIQTIPIVTNRVDRASRLARSSWTFVKNQAATIARTYARYEPLKSFSYLAAVLLGFSAIFLARAGYVFVGRRLSWFTESQSNDQALLLGGVLLVLATVIFVIGVVADLIGGVRRLVEEVLYRVRAREVADEERWRALDRRLAAIEDPIGHAAEPPSRPPEI